MVGIGSSKAFAKADTVWPNNISDQEVNSGISYIQTPENWNLLLWNKLFSGAHHKNQNKIIKKLTSATF